MTVSTEQPPPSRDIPKPVAGPLFRQAARLGAATKRQKLLCLIAAYADAGCDSPPLSVLREPLRIYTHSQFDNLLGKLVAAGHLEVAWRAGPNGRNVYTLHLNGRKGRRP